MVSSVLSPEKIVRRPTATREAAKNFIFGGDYQRSSPIQNVSNNIVDFQRAKVKPDSSKISEILSVLSSNIVGNVVNLITNSSQGLKSIYQNKLKKTFTPLGIGGKEKSEKEDYSTPTKILDKFLNVYKSALSFINFFSDRKNINKIGNNLDYLKKTFTESFEVAKIIRKIILKIVKQLSDLSFSGRSGGLNIGGGLFSGSRSLRSGLRFLSKLTKGRAGKLFGLGAGLLTAGGAVSGGAVNALQDSSLIQPQTTDNLPQNDVDRFASIVDRFAKAVSLLIDKATPSAKPSAKPSPSSGGTSPDGGTSPGDGGGNPPPISQGQTTQNVVGTGQKIDPGGGVSFYGPGFIGNRTTNGEIFTGTDFTAASPNLPFGTLVRVTNKDNGKSVVVRINDRGPHVKGRVLDLDQAAMTQLGGIGPGVLNNVDIEIVRPAPGTPAQIPPPPAQAPSQTPATQGTTGTPVSPEASQQPQPIPIQIKPVTPNQIQSQLQSIQNNPAIQNSLSTIVMPPIDLTREAPQQSTGGGTIAAAPSQKNGPSLPLLPASNPDNFLVLYSRMVYNIVDG